MAAILSFGISVLMALLLVEAWGTADWQERGLLLCCFGCCVGCLVVAIGALA